MTNHHSPNTAISRLEPTTLITTANDEQIMAMFWFLNEDNDVADLRMVAAAYGYETHHVALTDGLWRDLSERNLDGQNVLAEWDPPPPTPDHILAAKYDTDEGPIAHFIRLLSPAERKNARKRGFAILDLEY